MPVARILALTLAVLALAAPAACAATSTKKGIWGPVRIDGVSQFPTYKGLGVGVYNVSLSWADVAGRRPMHARDPADPAYRWPANLDDAVAEAQRYGIRLAVVVMRTPPWANGGRAWNWAPKRAQDYADFMYAAVKRYPSVRYWIVWGEPTRKPNFLPLPDNAPTAKRLTRAQARGPRKYAQILDAAYGAIKRANPRTRVVGGNSFTSGDISPWNWIRNLRLPSGRPPRMDLYGHNPFGTREPDLSEGPIRAGFADICDLDDLARWIDRNLGRTPRGGRIDLWLGEYTVPTAPSEFAFWANERTQARFLKSALRLTRRWRRIETLNWLKLIDGPVNPENGLRTAYGLLREDGSRKPSYYAYKNG